VIADFLGPVDVPRALAHRLDLQAGVIAHGLFAPEMVDLVIVGRGSDQTEVFVPKQRPIA
jgi:ribose 5-phosphate isomerase A